MTKAPRIISEEIKIETHEDALLVKASPLFAGTALGRAELGAAANQPFEISVCSSPTKGIAVVIGSKLFIFSFEELLLVALLQCSGLEGDSDSIIIQD